MIALALLAALAYLVLAACDLPGLWGQRGLRGEFRAALALYLLGLAYAVAVTLGWRTPAPWKVAGAIFRPIGTLLFKPKGG